MALPSATHSSNFLSLSHTFSSPHPPFISLAFRSHNRSPPKFAASALRGWKEYEKAVKDKDLARALRFLKSVNEAPEQRLPPADSPPPSSPPVRGLGLLGLERDWEVLDTCLNADDMRLVGNAYGFLRERGFLPNFGKCRNIVMDGPRDITPSILQSSSGLEAVKLSPKKWGQSGASSVVLAGFLGGASYLLSQGIEVRPNLAVVLGLALFDSIVLGGTCLAQISSYWPPYRKRILIHEAGHLLTAYLMGCPIRGVILDPIVAVQMGIQGQWSCGKLVYRVPSDLLSTSSLELGVLSVTTSFSLEIGYNSLSLSNLPQTQLIVFYERHIPSKKMKKMTQKSSLSNHIKEILTAKRTSTGERGPGCKHPCPDKDREAVSEIKKILQSLFYLSQAGTQFWDQNLENELSSGRLSSTAFDRYCMVLFAGIAAEALIYGEAEGGENDENLFRNICLLLEPPPSVAQMANQARWAVLQSYNLLKWHAKAHRAAVKALEGGGSLSQVIRSIEDAMSSAK